MKPEGRGARQACDLFLSRQSAGTLAKVPAYEIIVNLSCPKAHIPCESRLYAFGNFASTAMRRTSDLGSSPSGNMRCESCLPDMRAKNQSDPSPGRTAVASHFKPASSISVDAQCPIAVCANSCPQRSSKYPNFIIRLHIISRIRSKALAHCRRAYSITLSQYSR